MVDHRTIIEPICYVVKNPKTASWLKKFDSLTKVRKPFVKYEEPCSELLDVQRNSQYTLRLERLQ